MSDSDPHEELGIPKYPEKVSVETKKFPADAKPTVLTLNANLPSPQCRVEATVKQDMTGDGQADNQCIIIADKDGEHDYQLKDLEYGAESYWIEFTFISEGGMHQVALEAFKLRGASSE